MAPGNGGQNVLEEDLAHFGSVRDRVWLVLESQVRLPTNWSVTNRKFAFFNLLHLWHNFFYIVVVPMVQKLTKKGK